MPELKAVYITAGAAGMYCGSCLRDNTLVRTLRARGCDIQLVPVYTPIKTDEESVSVDRVFVGGINTYLQHNIPLLRYLPAVFDRWLNRPSVLRALAGGNVKIKAAELGELTVSMIAGEDGAQKKELRELVDWLKKDARPDLINLTNLLIAGFIPMLKRELNVPVVVTLQGDDLFLGELVEPYQSQVLKRLRELAQQVDAFVVNSRFYAEKMQQLLQVPAERFHVVPLGIDCSGFPEPTTAGERANLEPAPVVGYFARISPEKGFGIVTDAFIELRKLPGMDQCRLKVGGWLGAADRDFFAECTSRLELAGALPFFEHIGAPDRAGKLDFLRSVDVLCVPTIYEEPKGIFALEALASGKPVVLPRHGAFVELLERTGGGVLVEPRDALATASALAELLADPARCVALGAAGRAGVLANATAEIMADATLRVYEKILKER
ncbi:MAG: glycosyltransferase family 4 protein [Verrucomicrobia bacterium]|nr:glycosyltransferase family 4 protein [Verrucomicrobiota bacterium]